MTYSLFLFFYKDFLVEIKTRPVLSGILLYIVSTVFICYLVFDGIITTNTWNALFWIILLFASFNAILKGFINESTERSLYYYTIVSPKVFINSKIIYNTFLLLLLGIAAFVVFVFFMGNVIQNFGAFLIVLSLGIFGITSVLTMISAIASKMKNNFTVMSVLSFPVVLPQLLVIIKSSDNAINGVSVSYFYPDLIISFVISLIAILLSNILFPYIWQE